MDKLSHNISINSVSAAEELLKAAGTEVLFEKGHKEGDLHPNGKWYWKSSANNGKGDWRVIPKNGKKTQATKKPKMWEIHPDIAKCKTAKACQQYVMDKGYITYSSDISKADLKSAQLICSALVNLHDLIPYERIKLKMEKIKDGATMNASNGEIIRINSDYFKSFDHDKYFFRTNTRYSKNLHDAAKMMKGEIDRILKNNPNANVKNLQASYKMLVAKAEKFPCWTYGHNDYLAADLILHEMGHILNAQCTGSCGHWKEHCYVANHSKQERDYHLQLNQERDSIYDKNKKGAKVISEYSTTKNVEWFAENFVAWIHKDKEQPKYISDYFDKYFKTTYPRR